MRGPMSARRPEPTPGAIARSSLRRSTAAEKPARIRRIPDRRPGSAHSRRRSGVLRVRTRPRRAPRNARRLGNARFQSLAGIRGGRPGHFREWTRLLLGRRRKPRRACSRKNNRRRAAGSRLRPGGSRIPNPASRNGSFRGISWLRSSSRSHPGRGDGDFARSCAARSRETVSPGPGRCPTSPAAFRSPRRSRAAARRSSAACWRPPTAGKDRRPGTDRRRNTTGSRCG